MPQKLKIILSRDEIYKLYVTDHKEYKDMSIALSVCIPSVRKILKKLDIPLRIRLLNKITDTCLMCSGPMEIYRHMKGKRKFCSLDCYHKYQQINISEETRLKLSKIHIGKKQSIEHRLKNSGSNHHDWQGGITSENERLRKTIEYKEWRISILKRDDYTCKFCQKRGGKLHVDHIKPFSLFPELRLDMNNGRTLYEPCHKETDTYAGKIKTVNKIRGETLCQKNLYKKL
jgi:5-methylcytosine-specific restriction endonuclease McrA